MLACYLCNGRKFPDGADVLMIEDDFWEGFRSSEGYKRRGEENRVSYVWDALVEVLAATKSDWTVYGPCLEDPRKITLEAIASENRFHRRMLGQALEEFLVAHEEKRARMISVGSGRTYVYLNARADENPENVMSELSLRCYLVRGQVRENRTVVGIRFIGGRPPTEIPPESCVIRQEEWNAEDEAAAHELRQRFGFFSSSNLER